MASTRTFAHEHLRPPLALPEEGVSCHTRARSSQERGDPGFQALAAAWPEGDPRGPTSRRWLNRSYNARHWVLKARRAASTGRVHSCK
jgi:hypothetical protein